MYQCSSYTCLSADVAYLEPVTYDIHQPTAWIPLLDATKLNGCMEVSPPAVEIGRKLNGCMEVSPPRCGDWKKVKRLYGGKSGCMEVSPAVEIGRKLNGCMEVSPPAVEIGRKLNGCMEVSPPAVWR